MEINKLLNIKAIVFDIDGVMTDGGILATPDGDLLRVYDAKDSFAVRMAKMGGLITGVITGGSSDSIRKRFHTLGVDDSNIYIHSRIKMEDFEDFCTRNSLKHEEVMYFGDDLPDLEVIEACGIGVAPADAVEEVKAAADFISPFNGGHGCMRHGIEMVMRAQGSWNLDNNQYKKLF